MLTDGWKCDLSLEFRMDNTLLAHLENVCLMIGVHHDNMCTSDNKRSRPCVLPIILHSKTSFEGNASSQWQERSHQSKQSHSFLSVGGYGLSIMFPAVRL